MEMRSVYFKTDQKKKNMLRSLKRGLMAIILLYAPIVSQAQKKFMQGTIIYTMEYQLTDEQKSQYSGTALPIEKVTRFNNGITSSAEWAGDAVETLVYDHINKSGITLVDVANVDKHFALRSVQKWPPYTDFKVTGEKQNIGGFKAERYTYKDHKGISHELWASNEIELANIRSDIFPELKAFPVKYTLVYRGILTTITLKSLTEAKVGILSMAVPADYLEVTQEELNQSGGGN
jgi:hypothetical protein